MRGPRSAPPPLLLEALRTHRRGFAGQVLLGLLQPIFEGLAIATFYPVVTSVGQKFSGPQWLLAWSGTHSRYFLLGVLLVSICLKGTAAYFNGMLSARLRNRLGHELRSRVHRKIMDLSVEYVESQHHGTFTNLLLAQVPRFCNLIGSLSALIVNAAYALVFLTMMVYLSWQMTATLLLLAVAASTISKPLVPLVKRRAQAVSAATANVSRRFHETASAFREVRAFDRMDFEQERFNIESAVVRDATTGQDVVMSSIQPLTDVVSALLLCGVLLVGVYLSEQGHIPASALLTFLVILYRLLPQLRQIESLKVSIAGDMTAVVELQSFLSLADTSDQGQGGQQFMRLARDIRLCEVTYRYPAATEPALIDVSLALPAHRTTALVGPSGAGKTTLIQLLLGFYAPQGGTVYVDDLPLQQLSLSSWRAHVGWVGQHVYIFGGTVRENIAYGDPSASDGDITAAAQAAHAHEFISAMPDGYSTLVGDLGVRLSGGQRQRIALARALLRQPEIVILDEATSALDTLSERLVQEALEALGPDRTIILIAHRMSTVQNADQVIVLDGGRVVESGAPQELLQRAGLFALLHAAPPV